MTLSPRTQAEALAYARGQVTNPSQSWHALCQMFVHDAWGIPALFASAYAQWLGADPADKHAGGNTPDAPVGAALCFKGTNPFGHIMIAAHPFPSGNPAAFSNDLIRDGWIDKVHRTAPETVWGQNYLGYLTAVNGYDLQIHTPGAVPRPKHEVPYVGIQHAIDHMEAALQSASTHHDTADETAMRAEVARLKRLYKTLRRAG